MKCNFIRAAARLTAALFITISANTGCGQSRKLARIRGEELAAGIRLPASSQAPPQLDSTRGAPVRDTLRVTGLDGRELLIMRAVRDEASGEMVATEQLDAAVVTARFRNVAERHGRIDLEFQVTVPPEMHDSHWQLRLHPDMFILGDSLRLDDVVITGADYRKAQLKGYQHYERFISRIVNDTTLFVARRALEIFLERNIPQLYALRTDSTEVSDEQFESLYGVTEQQAVEHYTNRFARRRNEWRKSRREDMWRRYVKSPIVTDGIRLDTVIRALDGSFVYNYVQTINTRPKLRKVDITMCGGIFESDRQLYTIPTSESLTFYVSSVSAFVDGAERYKTMIISRSVSANTTAVIDFKAGRSDIDERLSDNWREILHVKENLRNLLTNESFELDSIIITAFASPEGTESANKALTYRRAQAASDYFGRYVQFARDSIRREDGFFVSVGDDLKEGEYRTSSRAARDIRFLSRSGGENWAGLGVLVEADSLLTADQKERYNGIAEVQDADSREKTLSSEPFYKRLRDEFYPRLRTVRFDFHLHRKGMVKDTVHTSVLDSVYMDGVQAIRDHDYDRAVLLLSSYQDYNTAVAYVALDRNKSALTILEECKRTAQVNYMLALVHQRLGDERTAVECYIRSCEQEPSYVHRGNLDPEIAALIKKYNLNSEQ